MHLQFRQLILSSALTVLAATSVLGQTTLPYDHIHLIEPAAEASAWWETHLPGGRRIQESPNRIMYGSTRLMFLGGQQQGGSQGSVIEHLGFAVADVDAKVRELTAAKVPYEVGISRFGELARAQMIGDERGLLKLLFDPASLRLLGVHVMGENATEIIHIGQAVLSMGGTIDYFRDTVFNYPTLAEAYKVTAFGGLNKFRTR